MKLSPTHSSLADLLRSAIGKSCAPKGPSGLPESTENSDSQSVVEGKYQMEDTTDPGIQNPVTGTGTGKVLGR